MILVSSNSRFYFLFNVEKNAQNLIEEKFLRYKKSVTLKLTSAYTTNRTNAIPSIEAQKSIKAEVNVHPNHGTHQFFRWSSFNFHWCTVVKQLRVLKQNLLGYVDFSDFGGFWWGVLLTSAAWILDVLLKSQSGKGRCFQHRCCWFCWFPLKARCLFIEQTTI